MKLYALTFHRKGRIPFPESIVFTPASEKGLTVFKQIWGDTITDRAIFGDKTHSDFEYFNQEKEQPQNIQMLTSIKAIKEQSEEIRQRDKAY